MTAPSASPPRPAARLAALAVGMSLALGGQARAQAVRDTGTGAETQATAISPRKSKPPVSGSESNLGIILLGGLALGVIAAAGGGGSKGGGKSPAGPDAPDNSPDSPPLPPAAPLPPASGRAPSDFETDEYKRNYSLGMINASSRYAAGGTGKNTLLSVFDTGADVDHADLAGNIAEKLSFSYYTGNGDVRDFDGHGTHVASIIAAKKNDVGIHGVAFDSRLMVLQGIARPSGDASSQLRTDPLAAWADAQRRSVRAGAQAINHSWSFVNENGQPRTIDEFDRNSLGAYLGSDVLDSLGQSTAAGLVTVFAAANSGYGEVSNTAGVPVYFPEFENTWLAVGAVDETGNIASYSNRCGLARDFCLVAPGSRITGAASSDAGSPQDGYLTFSGTSMAAPHVTGAVGVLKSNFPELTGAEISRILRDTATDLGQPGVDAVYGNGLLNLKNAVAPQGEVRIMRSDDRRDGGTPLAQSWIVADGPIAASLSEAFAGQSLMVTDGYDRGYDTQLSAFVTTRDDSDALATRMTGFALAASASSASIMPAASAAATGPGGWVDPTAFDAPYGDLIDGTALRLSREVGGFDVTLTGRAGSDGSYTSARLGRSRGGSGLSVEFGLLREKGAMLGTAVTGGFGSEMASDTVFARVGGRLAVGQSTQVLLSASYGSTDFVSSGVLAEGRGIASRALGIGLARSGVFAGGDRLTLGVSRPLGITGGEMTINTPVAMGLADGATRSDRVARSVRDVRLDAARTPTDLQIGYSTDLGPGRIALGALWRAGTQGKDRLGISTGFFIRF